MKKSLAILLIFILIIIVVFVYKYNSYKLEYAQSQKINSEYEEFTEGEILGTSLITLINKAMDCNEKNNIQKDENNFYIDNNINSIKIDIKFLEANENFQMEIIEKLGSEQFIKNFATASFKCTKKQYHEKTKNIKYLLFEQI